MSTTALGTKVKAALDAYIASLGDPSDIDPEDFQEAMWGAVEDWSDSVLIKDDDGYTLSNTDGVRTVVVTGTLGAARTVDLSAASVVGRPLEVISTAVHGGYDVVVDAGSGRTINGYRYWYLTDAYQFVRLRQVSASAWIVLDKLGTKRRFEDTSQRTQAGAVSSTFYRMHSSHQLTLEPGKWKIRYHVLVATSVSTQTDRIVMEAGLAASAAGAPINELDANVAVRGQASQVAQSFDFETEYDITSTTTLHLSVRQANTPTTAAETLGVYGNDETTVIEARRIA